MGLALAHVGDRPTDGDGPAEVGDGDGRMVEIGRGWRAFWALERRVKLEACGCASEEEVVFVRSIVNEARVRRMIGPNVARSILHGPGHLSGRVNYWASVGIIYGSCKGFW